MGDVVNIGATTTLDIPADRILESAVGKLEGVIVIGRTADGEFYFASSTGDAASILWDIEEAKRALFEVE